MKLQPTIYLNKNTESTLKANASVVFDDAFVVKGIAIRQRKDGEGVFVAMPSRKIGNDYKDDCHAITKEFKQELDAAILEAYEQKLAQSQSEVSDSEQKEGVSGEEPPKSSRRAKAKEPEQKQDADPAAGPKQDTAQEDIEETGMSMSM